MADQQHGRTWSQRRRFEFIEWKLFWEGRLNRSDLEDTFGISTPQASLDLRRYREEAAENVEYDLNRKGYRPAPAMKPRFLQVSAERLLLQLQAWLTGAIARNDLWFRDLPPVATVPDSIREVDAQCLRGVLAAINSNRAIKVRYRSLSGTRWRTIAPHALAFDGSRWHARAFAADHGDFRDFVLSRIDAVEEVPKVDYNPDDDLEWHTMVVLRICAHPGLNEAQRHAIERDHGMVNGHRDLPTRLSLAYYVIRRLNLDLDDLDPARAQLRLQNRDEVDAARVAARKAALKSVETRKQKVN